MGLDIETAAEISDKIGIHSLRVQCMDCVHEEYGVQRKNLIIDEILLKEVKEALDADNESEAVNGTAGSPSRA